MPHVRGEGRCYIFMLSPEVAISYLTGRIRSLLCLQQISASFTNKSFNRSKPLIRYSIFSLSVLLLLIVLLTSCSMPREGTRIREDVLYKTRIYCGNFVSYHKELTGPQKNTYHIVTDRAMFHIKELPVIPDSARCYFQLKETALPGGTMVWMLYFTWDGTDHLCRIRQNFLTGQIF